MNTILIVDDSEFFLELIRSFFKRSGCKTLIATSVREAIGIVRDNKPDLILLDQYMPDIKGDECCRMIKEDPTTRDIPVIMITASNKKEDKEKCFAAGCDDYVTKPINKEILLTKVKKYISISSRKYERAPICTNITYSSKGEKYAGQIYVISEGGAFIMGEKQLSVNAPIRLGFSIPGIAESLDLGGRVVWSFEGREKFPQILAMAKGMGIQFLNIGEEERKAIASYVSLGNYLI